MSTPSARSHLHPRVRQANPIAGQLLTRRRRRVLVTGAMTALLAATIALLPAPALAATPGGIVTWGNSCPDTPPAAASAGAVQVIEANFGNMLALKYDGTVVGWDGASVPAAASTGVVKVDASQAGFAVLKSNGQVIDDSGTLAQSGLLDFELAKYIGIGLKNGQVVAWDTGWGATSYDLPLQTIPGSLTSYGSATAVAAAHRAAYAVKNGGVIAWGDNSFGELNVPTAASSGVVAVSGGGSHALALKSDGSVVAWGNNSYHQTDVPSAAGSGVIAISAALNMSLALKSDGSVLAWGGGACGLTVSPPTSGVTGLPGGMWGTGHAVTGVTAAASLGGTLTSAPTVSKRPGTAIQDVFYLDGSNNVVHNTLTHGVLGTAENLGGVMKPGSTVASVSRTATTIDVFARGTEDALWHNSYNGFSWSGWTARSSAGHLSSSPTVASWGIYRLDVFAKGSGNDLQHTAYDTWDCGGWCSWGWESLGGTLTTAPAAVSWGTYRIDIFMGGASGVPQHKYFDWGTWWSGFSSLGGTVTSDLTVSSAASGEFDVYARNASNNLQSMRYSNATGWGSWQDHGSLSSPNGSAPAVNSFVTGNKALYYRGTDNALWQRIY